MKEGNNEGNEKEDVPLIAGKQTNGQRPSIDKWRSSLLLLLLVRLIINLVKSN